SPLLGKQLRCEELATRGSGDPHPADPELAFQVLTMPRTVDPAGYHLAGYGSGGIAGVGRDILGEPGNREAYRGSVEAIIEAVVTEGGVAARHPLAVLARERVQHLIRGQPGKASRYPMLVDQIVDLHLHRGDGRRPGRHWLHGQDGGEVR